MLDKYDLSQFRTVPNRKIKLLRHSRRTLRSSKMRVAGVWEPAFRRRLHLFVVLLKILSSGNPTQNIKSASILNEVKSKSLMCFGDSGFWGCKITQKFLEGFYVSCFVSTYNKQNYCMVWHFLFSFGFKQLNNAIATLFFHLAQKGQHKDN